VDPAALGRVFLDSLIDLSSVTSAISSYIFHLWEPCDPERSGGPPVFMLLRCTVAVPRISPLKTTQEVKDQAEAIKAEISPELLRFAQDDRCIKVSRKTRARAPGFTLNICLVESAVTLRSCVSLQDSCLPTTNCGCVLPSDFVVLGSVRERTTDRP